MITWVETRLYNMAYWHLDLDLFLQSFHHGNGVTVIARIIRLYTCAATSQVKIMGICEQATARLQMPALSTISTAVQPLRYWA